MAEMILQQAVNAEQKAKEQIQQQNRDVWAGTDFYDKIISYDVAIDTITAEGIGYLNITDSKGNTTTNAEAAQILLASPDKAIIIQDKNGNQFVVQKEGDKTKVTKVPGGGLQPGTNESTLIQKIIIALKKYQKAIDDYQASVKQPGKGGGPSLFAWELQMYLADLPECLAGSKDRLDEIEAKIVSLLAEQSTTLESFVDIVKAAIGEIESVEQEQVDQEVCTALTEYFEENIEGGLTAIINSDTLKTANQIFIVTDKSLKMNVKYSKDSAGEVSFRLTIKPEGGGSEIKNPSSDWKKVQNNESWVLELNSVQEGLYTLAYKVGTTTTILDFYVRTAAHDYACSVCGRNLKLTQTDLANIFPNSTIIGADPNIPTYFNEALKKGGFTTCHRQAHFFSQVYEESGGMNATLEKGSYSVPQMLKTYKDKAVTKDIFFKQSFWDNKTYLEYASANLYETSTDTTITKYEGKDIKTFKWNGTSATDTVKLPTSFSQNKPADYKKINLTNTQKTSNREKLFNLVYSNKNGNGNVASGDGYKFRGRGAIQLTGRTTYREVSNKCNSIFGTAYNWENNPEVLENDNKAIIYSVASFFLWKFGNLKNLDTKDVTEVTKKVNGGTNGLSARTSKFNLYLNGRLNNCKIKK
ncbi:MAG TPA: hypothetical protein VIM75_06740 [Ohtaekwangia sp.]|uniref:glycoside hydrolase family 19 protein n=1 Tax=Ohtaekwangia sp. TaxID=2066019 RepID=UPI002F92BCA7